MTKKPLVLIPCNVISYGGTPGHPGSPGHIARETYITALLEIADCIPLLLPAIGSKIDLDDLAGRVDGILLTGSITNVAPACYGEPQVFDDKLLDPARDATTLPLIRAAVKQDIPLIAVCRGFQEMNVAMGGTLHQRVQEQPSMMDHRPPADVEAQGIMAVYSHQAHKIKTQKGGLFEKWRVPDEFTVNTIHEQGIKQLGKGLQVEGIADDGLIEAISVPGKSFIFGTQWHPEGDTHINPVSKLIFEKFGAAVRGA